MSQLKPCPCCGGSGHAVVGNDLEALNDDLLKACQIAIEAFGDEEGEMAEQAIADIEAAIAKAKP